MVAAIIGSVISAGIMVGVLFLLRGKVAALGGAQTAGIQTEIEGLGERLAHAGGDVEKYASLKQLENVKRQLEEEKAALLHEKEQLTVTEGKLEKAQELVEKKEGLQQELKSSKEEDEKKLEELLSNYANYSTEAISLEKQLAASLKHLEGVMNQVPQTPEQKAILSQLMESLTSAGSRLRELVTEYQAIHERLEMLKQQHADLEDEYTKLVEQQLGD